MKEVLKTTKKEFVSFVVMAILSGIMIGIGGSASLLATATLGGSGKLIGAFLFTLGIFAIVTFEMRLFTGMVADIPEMKLKNIWKLPVCFLANIIGVGIVTLLVYNTAIGATLVEQSKNIANAKLNGDWILTGLCSSILCGGLITLSVWSIHHTPHKGLDASIGVMFPILVFAFCGFDHSVANVFYFYLSGAFINSTWQVVCYELICILGNVIGGIVLPLAHMFKEHSKKRD